MVVSSESGLVPGLGRAAVLLLGFFAFGCSSAKDDTAKELDKLRAEVASLRSKTAALSERLGAVEGGAGAPATAAPPAARAAAAPAASPRAAAPAEAERPKLEVVKLGPDSDSQVSNEAHTADAPPSAPPPAATGSGAGVAFTKAKSLFDKKQHEAALGALSDFVATFPDHEKVPEATFLRAQCHAQKGDKKRAVEQLEAALAMSGGSDLAPDVLLELAKAREKMGDPAGAKRARDRLRTEFSNSAAAKRLAR